MTSDSPEFHCWCSLDRESPEPKGRIILQKFGRFLEGPVTVLGCGEGATLLALATEGRTDLIGVELNDELAGLARSSGGALIKQDLLEFLASRKPGIGTYLYIDVIEHLSFDYHIRLLSAIPIGSRVILQTPYTESLQGHEYYFSARSHVAPYSPKVLRRMLSGSGYGIVARGSFDGKHSKILITSKFDGIVTFAELTKFLDMQAKHYSNGMYVRLGVAEAAHLEPEILLVDEDLTGGNLNFQRKCLGKIGDVAKTGRTVVLVSHKLNQICHLCHRVVKTDAGKTRMVGTVDDVLAAYESAMFAGDRANALQRDADTKTQFLNWEIAEPHTDRPHVLSILGSFMVYFHEELAEAAIRADYDIAPFNADRQLMWAPGVWKLFLAPGSHVLSHSYSTLPLLPGAYQWQVTLWDNGDMLDSWDCLPEMSIATEVHQYQMDECNGILNLPASFLHRASEETSVERAPHI